MMLFVMNCVAWKKGEQKEIFEISRIFVLGFSKFSINTQNSWISKVNFYDRGLTFW